MPLCGSHFEWAENGLTLGSVHTLSWHGEGPPQGQQQANQVLDWKLAVGLCKLISVNSYLNTEYFCLKQTSASQRWSLWLTNSRSDCSHLKCFLEKEVHGSGVPDKTRQALTLGVQWHLPALLPGTAACGILLVSLGLQFWDLYTRFILCVYIYAPLMLGASLS